MNFKLKKLLKSFLNVFLIILIYQPLFSTEITVMDDFGKPLIPTYIESANPFSINKNIIFTENNITIFANYYLPQKITINQKVKREVYLQRRKKIPINIKNIDYCTIVIKHKYSGNHFEKYLIGKPFFLPTFTKDEIAYIYFEHYYPLILFEKPYANKIFYLEKASNFCRIKLEKNINQQSLFENNIVPDGYLPFKPGTILKLKNFAYKVLDKNIIANSTITLQKEARISFQKKSNITFLIKKNGKLLKNYLYRENKNTIEGLAPGIYSISTMKGKIKCKSFENLTISKNGYNLGNLQCSTAKFKIKTIDESGNALEKCKITMFLKGLISKMTNKNGIVVFELKKPSKIKFNATKKGFAKYFSNTIYIDSDISINITLSKGSIISIDYSAPNNNIQIRGFGKTFRQPLKFKLEDESFISRNITKDTYLINFTDYTTNFTIKKTIKVKDGQDYLIDIDGETTSVSGNIEPQLPDSFEGYIKFKNKEGTINTKINNDSSFFIKNISFGTYTVFVQTVSKKTIAIVNDFQISENSSELTIQLQGWFWSGNITSQSIQTQAMLTVDLFNNKHKLIWSTMINLNKNEIYFPNDCTYTIFKYGKKKQKINISNLKNTDNIFLN